MSAAIAKARSFGKLLDIPQVMVDGGVENLNKEVDDLVESESINRTVALGGATPLEIYSGKWSQEQLLKLANDARALFLDAN